MSAPKGKRCGCRDPETGKQLGNACPKLRQRHHGFYEAAPRIDTSQGRRKLHRSGFATATERDGFIERVRELVRLAEGDPGTRKRIGDLLFEVTRYGGQLPPAEDVRQRLALGRDLTAGVTTGEWLRPGTGASGSCASRQPGSTAVTSTTSCSRSSATSSLTG